MLHGTRALSGINNDDGIGNAAGGIPADQSASHHREQQGQRSRHESCPRRRGCGRAHHGRHAAGFDRLAANPRTQIQQRSDSRQDDRLRRLRRWRRRRCRRGSREISDQRDHGRGQVRHAAARGQRRAPSHEVLCRCRRAPGARRDRGARLSDSRPGTHQGLGQPHAPVSCGVELRDDPAYRLDRNGARGGSGESRRCRRSPAPPTRRSRS